MKAQQNSLTDQSESPYLLIQIPTKEQVTIDLQSTWIEAQIDGVIADVKVRQIYVNQSKQTLEAIYVFPGSTRAAVYGLDIWVGDKEIHAKVKEREEARKEYESAKQEGKTAGLLEQHRPNVFQMNIANILPGDKIEVLLHYTELLEYDNGLYEFVYPGVVGPRYSTNNEQWVEQSINQLIHSDPDFNIKVTIHSGIPVQQVKCSSHQIQVEHFNNDKQVTVGLANPEDEKVRRDFILHYGLQDSFVQSGLMCYPHDGEEQFFLLMAQPPLKSKIGATLPREFIFIVDVSGSMNGFPMDISKRILKELLSSLRPADIFNVMLFEFSRMMLSDKSLPATPENIAKALDLICEQQGSGGTELYPALQSAFSFKTSSGFARTFLVVTDGYVTIESQAFRLIEEQRNKANVFALGIGEDVNRHLIEGIAYSGAGEAYIITNETDAKKVGSKLIDEISTPVWSHIEIDWGNFGVYDVEPIPIPDLFAARPLILYGKYSGKFCGNVTLKGQTAFGEYEQTLSAGDSEMVDSEALRYLWARNRIKYISDYASYFEDDVRFRYQSETPHHQQEITELGLKYNLLTKYTSFLAVDDRVRSMDVKLEISSHNLYGGMPGIKRSRVTSFAKNKSSVDNFKNDQEENSLIPKIEFNPKNNRKFSKKQKFMEGINELFSQEKDDFSLLLPEGVLDYFEIVKVEETTDEIRMSLEEKDNFNSDGLVKYESKGFYPSVKVNAFLVRGKQLVLDIRRRRWVDRKSGQNIEREFRITIDETKITQEFAAFLKGLCR